MQDFSLLISKAKESSTDIRTSYRRRQDSKSPCIAMYASAEGKTEKD